MWAFKNFLDRLGREDHIQLSPAGTCFLLYTLAALPAVTGTERGRVRVGTRGWVVPTCVVFLKGELWTHLGAD